MVLLKFYDTDFKKVTPYAPMGTRFFDLCDVLQADNLPDVETIAELLYKKYGSDVVYNNY
ncbi:MAG: hypothetical protein LUB59_06700 [Candidatus Gastranaerophilales bacterium]|nr:hypothetical protein [Candidatus Gastranaerophilales bacterium]